MKYKVIIYLCTVLITSIVAIQLYEIVEYDLDQTTQAQRDVIFLYLGSLWCIIWSLDTSLPMMYICSFLYFAFFFCPVMGLLKAKEKESFYGLIALQVFILLVHLAPWILSLGMD